MPPGPSDPRDTPAMRQYYRFKKQHPDCLLLFRIGDFYETFDDDAVTISKAAGLTLTQRTEGVPMAGMPYHQLDTYLRRLIDKGYRVAVCDQTETPVQAKARASASGGSAVIERAVTRVLTPGTLVDDSLLEPEAVANLAGVCFPDGGNEPTSPAHAAIVDLSTGAFTLIDSTVAGVADELIKRSVSELLYSAPAVGDTPPRVKGVLSALAMHGGSGSGQPAWHFRREESLEIVKETFGVSSLEGFDLRDDDPAIPAAGAVLRYLRTTQPGLFAGREESKEKREEGPREAAVQADGQEARPDVIGRIGGGGSAGKKQTIAHLRPPRREDAADCCILDATSLRSLEVLSTMRATAGVKAHIRSYAGLDGSLLGVFARSETHAGCRTACGKRLIRDWLCRPLRSIEGIRARQQCVATLVSDRKLSEKLSESLGEIQDVARISGRISLERATPRDLVALGRSLKQVEHLRDLIDHSAAFARLHGTLSGASAALRPLCEEITRQCVDSPPQHFRDGGLIRDGVDAALDEARLLQRDAASWMAQYQAKLAQDHSLPSLKVGFNKIFGYYIELPSAQAKRAPDIFSRKQTLKNAERFITPELREFELKVSSAEARALEREAALFAALCDKARAAAGAIDEFSNVVGELDVLLCFADKAASRGWVRPEIVEQPLLEIKQGRHPALDELLENQFVPNDVELATKIDGGSGAGTGGAAALTLITGPNMAGKSTFIRQTALLVLLAHAGSYLPAESARVGVTDRIFTRVGADDALHAGQSTFMVEMTETARILNHATAKSLVILDEIGRGTSTLDGLSLAWAIAEYLAGAADVSRRPRTLFATHYHELTDLEALFPGRVRNLHVAVREWGDEIIFLHRILPGKTDRSYGIHVAKLAGLPAPAIRRAKEILENLAVHHAAPEITGAGAAPGESKSVRGRRGPSSARGAAAADRTREPSLFGKDAAPPPPPHPAVDALRELKLDAMSPLQAFDMLRVLKEQVQEKPLAPQHNGRADAAVSGQSEGHQPSAPPTFRDS